MAWTKFNQPVSEFTAGITYIVIRIPDNVNVTALGYCISLRRILNEAWRDNKEVYIVCDKVEKLESLIDENPYIFDSGDICSLDCETKVEFFTSEEFEEFSKNHKLS